MNLDHLFEYLFPIAIFLLYFFVNTRKKKEQPKRESKKEELKPEPVRKIPSQQKPEVVQQCSQADSSLGVTRCDLYSNAVEDPVYAHKTDDKVSRAQKLLEGRSLRDVFLIKEILDRPYD